MPAVAVIGGIASAVSGAAAFSAAAGFTLANVAAGLAVVGGVSTALGAITGNKKLMKFGMITGLAGAAAGGIASLANSAADTAASAGASTASSVSEAVASNADALTMPTVSEISSGVAAGQDMTTPFMVTGKQVLPGTGLLGSVSQQAPVVADAAANTSAVSSIADSAATNSAISSGFAPSASSTMDLATSPFKKFAGPVASDTGSSVFGNFGQFIQKNPELVKAGTGILSGLGQAKMQQEQMDWKERTEAERRARINASILGQRSNF